MMIPNTLRRLAGAGLVATIALLPIASRADPTLYDDLGGKAGIERFVGGMLAIAAKDPRIAHDFDNINFDWLRPRLTIFLCQLTGGPCHYAGRDLKAAHKGLHLQTHDFNALVEDLQTAMDNQGISFWTQNRLLALMAPMHRDVVSR